jgi:hypothetical protein
MEFVPLKTRIRDWYKNQPKWALVLAFLFLLLFVDKVVRSGPEFKAIAWHRRHGDHITVKGVTFPVHFWYAPKELQDEFSISDEPGPLRPTSSKAPTFFSIKAYKDEKDIGTPKGLVETRIHEFERSGYHGLSKFQMNIRSQTLDCMQEHDARFFGPTIYCYGEGPFYSVFFVGSDQALTRFRQMISDPR